MDTRNYAKWLYRLSLTLVGVILLYVIFLLKPVWQPILQVLLIASLPFLLGAFIAYLLHPLVEKLNEAGIHRAIAILLIYILFFGGIGYGIYKGTPLLIHQLKDLSENAPVFTKQYRKWLHIINHETSTWPDGIQTQLKTRIDGMEEWLTNLVATLLSGFMKFMNSLIYFAIVPFISFYLLKDIHKVKRFFWHLIPNKWRYSAKLFSRDLDKSLGGYIRGQLLVCTFIGGLAAVTFWFLDMKYPLILSLIIGITNVIPYFGPIIGAIPAVIVAGTISNNMIIYVVILVFVLQFIEGNILSPLIVGKSLHMHPLFIMGALIVGGEVGGIVGLIIAVPLLAMVKVALLHARTHFIKTSREKFKT
jgi:predicted PurR-regulated permease PerM